MYTVHQHWDPLKVCAVGRSYPPEFYSRIQNAKVRNVMERIAIETEEDYQKLISKLKEFNVKVIRTDVSEDPEVYVNDGVLNVPPPMTPRDFTAMVGDTFYMPGNNYGENFDVDLIISEMFENIYQNKIVENTTYNFCKEIEDCINPKNKLSPKESFIKLKSRMFRGQKRLEYYTDIDINLDKKSINACKLKKFINFNPIRIIIFNLTN